MNDSTSNPQTADRQQFGFLVADVLRLMRADFALRVRGTSLTAALHRLLIYASRNPGCRQVELAEWLDITPVTVGRMIDRLERQGLLRREADPGDRRVARIFVESAADAVLARINDLSGLTRERALQGLSPAECEALLRALSRVRSNLAPAPAATTAGRRPVRGR